MRLDDVSNAIGCNRNVYLACIILLCVCTFDVHTQYRRIHIRCVYYVYLTCTWSNLMCISLYLLCVCTFDMKCVSSVYYSIGCAHSTHIRYAHTVDEYTLDIDSYSVDAYLLCVCAYWICTVDMSLMCISLYLLCVHIYLWLLCVHI